MSYGRDGDGDYMLVVGEPAGDADGSLREDRGRAMGVVKLQLRPAWRPCWRARCPAAGLSPLSTSFTDVHRGLFVLRELLAGAALLPGRR